MNPTKICLWSGPRNISTTLMYSFAQRSDCAVVDEPLYGYFLSNDVLARKTHPMSEQIISSMECDAKIVINGILTNQDAKVQFYKQMTHHLIGVDLSFLSTVNNIILTRDPLDMLPSYDSIIPNPKMKDVGYKDHLELISYMDKHNIRYAVLDAKKVLLNPKAQLLKLCDFLKIPFENSMLHWKKGRRPEDGIWADVWYHSIHNSTGFKPYNRKTKSLPPHLQELWKDCDQIYQMLLKKAL